LYLKGGEPMKQLIELLKTVGLLFGLPTYSEEELEEMGVRVRL
jgi:hypothetical protein